MRNTIITIITLIMALTITLPAYAAPNGNAKQIGVITCDDYGHKTLDVFYPNGQIHIFKTRLVKKYKVGQIVKVTLDTNGTRKAKDDEIIRIRKTKTNDEYINAYADDYTHWYWKTFKSGFGITE